MSKKYLLVIIPAMLIFVPSSFAFNQVSLIDDSGSAETSPIAESVFINQGEVIDSEINYGETETASIADDPIQAEEIAVLGEEPEDPSPAQFSNKSFKGSRTHGKIISRFRYNNKIRTTECSGAVVQGPKRPVVVTAAHCVFLWRLPKIGRIPTKTPISVNFYPGLKLSEKRLYAPFGVYPVTNIQVKRGVVNYLSGDKTGKLVASYDWAFLRISKIKQIKKYVGSDGISFNSNLIGDKTKIIGYPGSRYNGSGGVKSWCNTAVTAIDKRQVRPKPYLAPCPVLGGMSGGGWRDNQKPNVISITSYLTSVKGVPHTGGVRLEDSPRNPSGPYRDYLDASS
jgi:hypothetical protein